MAPRILVVDDEAAIVENIVYALKTEGFETVSCPTAQEALEIIGKTPVNLIVLDIGLPDRSGIELCKDIRKSSAVPVIFLTALSSEVDRVVGLEIGGDDYVVKPFSPRELSARVKAILRRSAPVVQPQGCATPFNVDVQRMKVSFFGSQLELSRYEFRILRTLLERPGWVFSRDKLMDSAWEEPGASLDRTVDTHIKTLRAKLRKIKPDIDPIETHRGLGYSIRETW